MTGRVGTVGVKSPDGAGRYLALTFFFHGGTGRKIKVITTGRDGIYLFARQDGTRRDVFFSKRDGTVRYIFVSR